MSLNYPRPDEIGERVGTTRCASTAEPRPTVTPGFSSAQKQRLREFRAKAYSQTKLMRRSRWRTLPSPAAIAALVLAVALLLSAVMIRQLQLLSHSQADFTSETLNLSIADSDSTRGPKPPAGANQSALVNDGDEAELSAASPSPADQIVVHVSGAVAAPAVVTLKADARVNDAVQSCGGLLPEADLARINLAANVRDGDHIHVLSVGETDVAANAATVNLGNAVGRETVGTSSCVDIRTANVETLESLPGIGPALAARIVQHRTEHPFQSPEDLRAVSGIGEKTYAGLAQQLCH